jgi:hypothetical protein
LGFAHRVEPLKEILLEFDGIYLHFSCSPLRLPHKAYILKRQWIFVACKGVFAFAVV